MNRVHPSGCGPRSHKERMSEVHKALVRRSQDVQGKLATCAIALEGWNGKGLGFG